MRRSTYFLWSVLMLVVLTSTTIAQNQKQRSRDGAKQESSPTAEEVTRPTAEAPAEVSEEATAAQPIGYVYVGSEGAFSLNGAKSRGIFRWQDHWANSMAYRFEDSNYWIYKMDGYTGWFAFDKSGSGGRYVLWKGTTNSSGNIDWQDVSQGGWMRATRGSLKGNGN